MVANHGYLPEKVNFAARIAKNRVNPDVPLDLIASFKAAAETDPGRCSSIFPSLLIVPSIEWNHTLLEMAFSL